MANYGTLVYLAGSASAEFFADIALSPFEAVKVGPPALGEAARGWVGGGAAGPRARVVRRPAGPWSLVCVRAAWGLVQDAASAGMPDLA
jgi:hypothetical protein